MSARPLPRPTRTNDGGRARHADDQRNLSEKVALLERVEHQLHTPHVRVSGARGQRACARAPGHTCWLLPSCMVPTALSEPMNTMNMESPSLFSSNSTWPSLHAACAREPGRAAALGT
jgi:hypothetical protein